MEVEKRQIIEQCKKGNLEEFEKLYNCYFKKIYSFIYYRTHHKETAEDLTSQTFIKALEKIKTFNPDIGTFSAWIYRIARNKTIDYYRTKKSEIDISNVWGLSSGQNMGRNLEVKEKLEEVAKYLKNINQQQREIITMRVWDNLSYKEISEITGKNEASCRMVFSRAIKELRKEITISCLLFILLI